MSEEPVTFAALKELLHGVIVSQAETSKQMQETDKRLDKLSARVDATSATVDRLSARVDATSATVDQLSVRVDAALEKTIAKLGKKIDAVNENVGGLSLSIGHLVESMVEGGLLSQFQALDYTFTKYARDVNFDDSVLKLNVEIDFLLENGDTVMPVEVKTKLTRQYVNRFLRNLQNYHLYADARGDARRIVGAVAGGYVSEATRDYAHSKGLYVIRVYSDHLTKVLPTPEGFVPACW